MSFLIRRCGSRERTTSVEQKLFLSAQMNEELFSLHAAGSLSFYLQQGRVKIMFAVPVEVTGRQQLLLLSLCVMWWGCEDETREKKQEFHSEYEGHLIKFLLQLLHSGVFILFRCSEQRGMINEPRRKSGTNYPESKHRASRCSVSAVNISGVTRTFVPLAVSVVSTVFVPKVKLEMRRSSSVWFRLVWIGSASCELWGVGCCDGTERRTREWWRIKRSERRVWGEVTEMSQTSRVSTDSSAEKRSFFWSVW